MAPVAPVAPAIPTCILTMATPVAGVMCPHPFPLSSYGPFIRAAAGSGLLGGSLGNAQNGGKRAQGHAEV